MAGRSRGNAKAGGAPPRLQPVDLRPEHTTPAAVARYAAAFAAGTPFPHLVVRDVLPDSLLRAVRDEVLAGPRFAKRNDLYDFSQSESLRLAGGPASAALCSTLYSPAFRAWISSVTGVETTAQMDLSAAVYGPGSYLLCHDDDLAARRIAFILYLVPEDWDAARDGGTLDLFDSIPGAAVETAAVPRAVARRLAPAWNALAFFAVSHLSHHQVAEVLSRAGRAGPRVSVSGWFYGPPLARPPPPPPPPVRFIEPRLPPAEAEAAAAASAKGLSNPALDDGSDDPLTAWVSPAYLRRGAMAAVAAQFARDASVQLNDFLLPHRYAAVMRALAVKRWRPVGPPNIRNYRLAHSTADDAGEAGGEGILPDEATRLFRFLTSHNFRCLCGALTSGDPAALGPVHAELRAFGPGDYTLLSDPEYLSQRRQRKAAAVAEQEVGAGAAAGDKRGRLPPLVHEDDAAPSPVPPAGVSSAILDATLCFCAPPSQVAVPGDADAGAADAEGEEEDPLAWPASHGGHVTYLTGDDELLTVLPRGNALSLVALEPGVLSFVKLVSRAHAGAAPRYDAALRFAAVHQNQATAETAGSSSRSGGKDAPAARGGGVGAGAASKKKKHSG